MPADLPHIAPGTTVRASDGPVVGQVVQVLSGPPSTPRSIGIDPATRMGVEAATAGGMQPTDPIYLHVASETGDALFIPLSDVTHIERHMLTLRIEASQVSNRYAHRPDWLEEGTSHSPTW